MYQPLVTIVIPVYNGANYLSESINSALNQTYKNIEIIVVNDGSNDNGETEKIAMSFGNKIRYFCKKNGGVSSALNLCIDNMKGDWLSWLSHDDLYYPTKVEEEVAYVGRLLESNPDLNLNRVVVRCAAESIDIHGKTILKYNYRDVKEKEPLIEMILNNVYNYRLAGCSFLLPSAAFKDVGKFNENIRTVSDAEYWYRLLFAGYDFYFLNRCLIRGRVHKRQVGKTRVTTFDIEGNNLHRWIADQIYANENYRKGEYFLRLGGYLRKRLMPDASNYAFEYAKKLCSPLQYTIISSWFKLYFSIIGNVRNMVRSVYRKIKVK